MNPFVRLKKIKQNIGGNTIKILSNVAWAMGGKIVNMAGTLLVGILVARYLGPEQYGLMNYVISYVSIFSVLYNPQIEMFARFKMKSSFHKTKRII